MDLFSGADLGARPVKLGENRKASSAAAAVHASPTPTPQCSLLQFVLPCGGVPVCSLLLAQALSVILAVTSSVPSCSKAGTPSMLSHGQKKKTQLQLVVGGGARAVHDCLVWVWIVFMYICIKHCLILLLYFIFKKLVVVL